MSRILRQTVIAAALLALPASVALASAAPTTPAVSPKSDISPVLVKGPQSGSAQHPGLGGHLPSRRENFELVSKLELTGRFGDVSAEQIADVAVYKGFAYLNSWNEPTCSRGGTYIVDIREPRNPKEIGFVAAPPRSIHGEGAHVVTYKGRDILAVNNEPCTFAATGTGGPGGFDLIDVTDPFNPVKLGTPGVPTGGDTGPDDGSLTGTEVPHSNHSTVMWESPADGKLYLITVDNPELHDVDIHDISDPANPVGVAEYELLELFPQIEDSGNIGSFAGTFHHDTKVKIVDGKVKVITSNWDGGYVTYDLTDPQAPKYIGDSSFAGGDPLLTDLTSPEGNAHYAEFSHDDTFVLAADEDFTTHRAGSFDVEGTPFAAAGIGGGAAAAILPDRVMNGPTVYGGYACNASKPVPPRSNYTFQLEQGEEAILVVQRGPTQDTNNPEEACFPGVKGENAWDAGWRNVLYVNRHFGSAAGDGPSCGSGGYVAGKIPVSICTTHTAAHDIFDTPPAYGLPYDDETDLAPVGTQGDKVRATSEFDGWGYAHLYRNNKDKLERIDSWAVEESLDERYSAGFGDLSIHEHATDPTENLSYVAYYSAGARAIRFSDAGIEETGVFIDQGGNNFWGVEVFNGPAGNRDRLLAFSDRDYGLYILRYTGPGAVVPSPPVAAPPAQPLAGRDATRARISLLSKGRQSLRSLRSGGLRFQLRFDEAVRLEVTLMGRLSKPSGSRGAQRKLATARVSSVAAGQTVTVTLRPSAAMRQRLRRERRLPGFLRVKAVDAAGNVATRTKVVSFR